ncbi:MAG: fasciclin domain-containing protein [Planctomycetes bacterium]|nr:fasciclin domain-containing protein [Planctomycetota bacterium]
MKGKLLVGLSLAILIAAVRPAPAEEPKTVADVLAASKEHKILVEALTETRLFDTIKDGGEWTVFAPTDAAFKGLDEATDKKNAGNKAAFKKFMQGHVVKGKLSSADLVERAGKEVETLSGVKFKVTVEGKNVFVGGAKLTKPDVKAGNGIVHVVDSALVPPK